MSKTSVSGIVFLETRLKSVEKFVFTKKLLGLVMNNPSKNFWWDGEKWNGAVVLRVKFGGKFTLGGELSLIERLKSWQIGLAKISSPSFRNLPDKLSMPAALDGFKPFKILNIISGDVSENSKF